MKYFMQCTFPREEYSQEPNCFHILGVDIILDSKLNPWVLEINANPSMNIESTIAKRETDDSVSLIDLHVKSMALSHAVKLCLKSNSSVRNYVEYDSYTQIYSNGSQQLDQFIPKYKLENYNPVYILLDIFLHINGHRFKPTLLSSKFTKLVHIFKIVGSHFVNKVEIEKTYHTIVPVEELMDFYSFVHAIEQLVDKAWGVKDGGKIRNLQRSQAHRRDENGVQSKITR